MSTPTQKESLSSKQITSKPRPMLAQSVQISVNAVTNIYTIFLYVHLSF